VTLVLGGVSVPTPGVDTRSWVDDPRLPHIGASRRDDGSPRRRGDVRAIVLHTTKGRPGPMASVPPPPSEAAERYARYQGRTARDVSWHYTVDVDGTIVQSADPDVWECWHAGLNNDGTVGIELVQRDDLALYGPQLDALVWLVATHCDRYGIPRTFPVGPDGRPWQKIIPELMKAPEGDAGRSWRGVYGHRNCSRRRGAGDPTDHPFAALLAAGFAPIRLDAKGRRSAPGAPVCGDAPTSVRCVPALPPGLAAWPPVPEWIDEDREVTDTADRTVAPEAWVREAASHLRSLGAPEARVAEVIAHCAVETGWGRRGVAHNHGGVKLSQTDTRREERRAGEGLPWWRWAGHRASGDDPVVYYRAFPDDAAFWAFWLARYAPRSADVAERDRYIATGAAFWGDPSVPSGDAGGWFVAMLRAGYRGPVRQQEIREARDPAQHESVSEHRDVVRRVRMILRDT